VDGAVNFVIPEINMLEEFIDDDTIIFIRGGFRHWHDFLLKYKDTNWLICYAANTGRDKWTWWDIVFDDLTMSNDIDRHGRYHFPFIKPTNEQIFDVKECSLKYDICIGASNIHDKKGQFKSVEVIEAFHKLFGYYPTAVMPGAFRRSLHTTKMMNKPFFNDEIHTPGMLTKPELSDLFATCKIFMHLGTGGQNDRSILEAHACGVPVILSNTSRFTPLLEEDNMSTFVFGKDALNSQLADRIFSILYEAPLTNKIKCRSIYKQRMGYDEIIIPMLSKFFKILDNTKPNLETKERLTKEFKSFQKEIKS